MLDDKTRAVLDQGIAEMAEVWPRMIRSLYDGYIAEGFDVRQSIELAMFSMRELFRNSKGDGGK